jgi:hypothetical protein
MIGRRLRRAPFARRAAVHSGVIWVVGVPSELRLPLMALLVWHDFHFNQRRLRLVAYLLN